MDTKSSPKVPQRSPPQRARSSSRKKDPKGKNKSSSKPGRQARKKGSARGDLRKTKSINRVHNLLNDLRYEIANLYARLTFYCVSTDWKCMEEIGGIDLIDKQVDLIFGKLIDLGDKIVTYQGEKK